MSRRLFRLQLLLRRPGCWRRGHPQGDITKYGHEQVIVGRGCRCGKRGAVTKYTGRYPVPRAD